MAATVGDMAVDTGEDMAAATVEGTVDHKAATGEDFKAVMEVDMVDLKVKYSFFVIKTLFLKNPECSECLKFCNLRILF